MADEYKFPMRLRAAMAHAAVVLQNSASDKVRELDEDSQHLIRRTLDELDSACVEANLAVHPQAVERPMQVVQLLQDISRISMSLAADLVKGADYTFRGHDYLDRNAVVERVLRWRAEWDALSPARAALLEQARPGRCPRAIPAPAVRDQADERAQAENMYAKRFVGGGAGFPRYLQGWLDRAAVAQGAQAPELDSQSAAAADRAREPQLPAGYAYSLPDLQAEAQAQFGMTPDETLAAAQGLYKRNLITDPVTEERRLAQFMFEEAASIINSYKFVSGQREYDPEYEAPCWTRDLESIEMGIMPRGMPAAALFGFSMSEAENCIYGLVHARFLSLFTPPGAGHPHTK